MATLSVRTLARDCLGITETVSVRSDILAQAPLLPEHSLRNALEFIHRHRCRPKAPTKLQVTGVTNGVEGADIGLLWIDNADNEDGFRIRFRGKKAGRPDDEGTKTIDSDERTPPGEKPSQALLRDVRNGFEYTISIVAFNAAGESPPSNEVEVTTPNVEESRRVSLHRQEILEGFPPYLGKFPEGGVIPNGRLLRIRLPQVGLSDTALLFTKRGFSTADCAKPSAVIALREGDTTTPDQLKEIFGVPEPTFATVKPISFVACLSTRASFPNFVDIEITIIFD